MKRREYTTPEQKREIMLKAGLEPQEAFVHKDNPWRSLCLVCGKEVSPRFGSIRQGQGGCKYCAGVALTEEDEAVKIMQSAGLEPLVSYVNSKTPWKATCRKCGHVNSPTLANVKWRNVGCKRCAEVSRAEEQRLTEEEVISSLIDVGLTPIGDLSYENSKKPIPARCVACSRVVSKSLGVARQGSGCPYCSNKKVSPEEAHEFMLTNGAKPLVNYLSGTSPWKCTCTTCQREITPTYSAVKSGQSPCAYCAGKRVDLQEAQELLKKKKLLPLVPYPGSSKQWRCECLICGRETFPTYANLRAGHSGCVNCAGKYLDPEDAVKKMEKAGLSPLVPYVSRQTPWLSKCRECGKEVKPRLASISRGGGCKYCAEIGIDYSAAGYVYLITHLGMQSHKVGIANINPRKKHYNRVSQHESQGWILISKREFPTADLAHEVEQAFLAWVRVDLGLGIYLSKNEMPYGGFTETFSGFDSIELFEKKLNEIASAYRERY